MGEINTAEKMRIDKWLWAVRFFKSRSIAAEACGKGKIKIGDEAVKASKNIRVGELISIRKGAFTLQYEVLQLTGNRVPAKVISDFYKDVTPQEEMEKIKKHIEEMKYHHYQGEGRPTKKDRRSLDKLMDF